MEIAVSAHLIAAIGEAEGNHAHGVLRADAADQSISGLVLVIGELLAGQNCWCLRVEHEANGSRAGDVTGHIGLTHGDGVAAFDGREAIGPGLAAVGAVLDGGAGFGAADGQSARVGDAVRAACTRVASQRNGGGSDLSIQNEADGSRAGRITGHIGLANGNGVVALDRSEGRSPGLAAIDAVFDGCTGFGAADGQSARVGNEIRAACTRVASQRNGGGSDLSIQNEADGSRAGGIAGHISLAHGDRVAAFDRSEGRGPALAAVGAVVDGGAGFGAADGQSARVGDAVRAACTRVASQRNARRGDLSVEHEADGSRTRGVAGHVGLAYGNGVAAFDRGEGRGPGLAAVGAVLDGGADFGATDGQGARVGDAVRAACARIASQRNGRCGDLGVEHKADSSRAGRIAGHIGLTDGYGVVALDRSEGRSPGLAAVGAVFDGRTGFGTANGQGAVVSDAVVRVSAVELQRNVWSGRCGGVDERTGRRGAVFLGSESCRGQAIGAEAGGGLHLFTCFIQHDSCMAATGAARPAARARAGSGRFQISGGVEAVGDCLLKLRDRLGIASVSQLAGLPERRFAQANRLAIRQLQRYGTACLGQHLLTAEQPVTFNQSAANAVRRYRKRLADNAFHDDVVRAHALCSEW